MPGSDTWQEYPYGFGPDPAGLFAQGNFGVVTKMGFRLLPLPEHYRTGSHSRPQEPALIEICALRTCAPDGSHETQLAVVTWRLQEAIDLIMQAAD